MSEASASERPRGGRLPRNARRAQLLGAALDVFVERGYHAASMDDIADEAGVSKPVLYQHFPSKLELYLALLDSSVDTIVAAVDEALAATEDNRARVHATIDVLYSYVSKSEAAFRLVFESDLTSDPDVRTRMDRMTTETARAVATVIRSDTGLSKVASELLAVSLVGMAQIGGRYWLDNAQALTKDEAVDLVSRLGWRGISGIPLTEDPSA
ncbi:MAG: TetR/AcrR family transcriptional regulator [Nocardioidaceae bacterium]